jgi:hypothetical protein
MLELFGAPFGREEGGCGRDFEAKDRAAVPGGTRKSWICGGIILGPRPGRRGRLQGTGWVFPLLYRNGYFQRAGKHGQMQLGRDDVRGSDARRRAQLQRQHGVTCFWTCLQEVPRRLDEPHSRLWRLVRQVKCRPGWSTRPIAYPPHERRARVGGGMRGG